MEFAQTLLTYAAQAIAPSRTSKADRLLQHGMTFFEKDTTRFFLVEKKMRLLPKDSALQIQGAFFNFLVIKKATIGDFDWSSHAKEPKTV
jgi:hypothetical protein